MYYEDVIRPLYEQQYATLYQFVLRCFNAVISEMEVSIEVRQTPEYVNSDDQAFHDMRWLIHKKSQAQYTNTPYHQVFDTRFGFRPNLSILDLLFNLGPESLSYLNSQQLAQNANGM